MEEAILNSLLRYSKQVTPSRETYPIPNYSWNSSLRRSNPPINLSTYYLLDQPSLSKSPTKKIQRRKTTNLSYASPNKTNNSPQKRASHNISTEPSRRITEPETEVKNVAKVREEKEKIRKFKSFDSAEGRSSPRLEDQRYDFSSFQQTEAQVVNDLKDEISRLKAELHGNSDKISTIDSVNK